MEMSLQSKGKIISILISWVVIWVIGWLAIGSLLPENIHSPYAGIASPLLAPITLVSGPMFTLPVFYELYLPFIVFWSVFVGVLYRVK